LDRFAGAALSTVEGVYPLALHFDRASGEFLWDGVRVGPAQVGAVVPRLPGYVELAREVGGRPVLVVIACDVAGGPVTLPVSALEELGGAYGGDVVAASGTVVQPSDGSGSMVVRDGAWVWRRKVDGERKGLGAYLAGAVARLAELGVVGVGGSGPVMMLTPPQDVFGHSANFDQRSKRVEAALANGGGTGPLGGLWQAYQAALDPLVAVVDSGGQPTQQNFAEADLDRLWKRVEAELSRLARRSAYEELLFSALASARQRFQQLLTEWRAANPSVLLTDGVVVSIRSQFIQVGTTALTDLFAQQYGHVNGNGSATHVPGEIRAQWQSRLDELAAALRDRLDTLRAGEFSTSPVTPVTTIPRLDQAPLQLFPDRRDRLDDEFQQALAVLRPDALLRHAYIVAWNALADQARALGPHDPAGLYAIGQEAERLVRWVRGKRRLSS
jgi:hypothetical protein